jgi:hypothetical protein
MSNINFDDLRSVLDVAYIFCKTHTIFRKFRCWLSCRQCSCLMFVGDMNVAAGPTAYVVGKR